MCTNGDGLSLVDMKIAHIVGRSIYVAYGQAEAQFIEYADWPSVERKLIACPPALMTIYSRLSAMLQ